MENSNNPFDAHPDWVSIAYSKDPEKLANAVYFDFKQTIGQNVQISQIGISSMISDISQILKEYYSWEDEKISDFIKKFQELTQYYTPILNGQLPPEFLSKIFEGISNNPELKNMNEIIILKPVPFSSPLSPPLLNIPTPQSFTKKNEEKERNTTKKPFKKKMKYIVKVFVKGVLYWLALVGLFTILGF